MYTFCLLDLTEFMERWLISVGVTMGVMPCWLLCDCGCGCNEPFVQALPPALAADLHGPSSGLLGQDPTSILGSSSQLVLLPFAQCLWDIHEPPATFCSSCRPCNFLSPS